MCTLIVLNDHIEGYPLIVASNRDEFYDRPSTRPQLIEGNIFAPQDQLRGGTWEGITQDGFYVGLTNQDGGEYDPNMRSRGEVVMECLRSSTHQGTIEHLSSLNTRHYNAFNIVFGRIDAVFIASFLPEKEMQVSMLPKGISVITNDCSPINYYHDKIQRALSLTTYLKQEQLSTIIERLRKVLAHHETNDDPHMSLCVHNDVLGFGTRSSSIIAVSKFGELSYYHSEGHPCKALEK